MLVLRILSQRIRFLLQCYPVTLLFSTVLLASGLTNSVNSQTLQQPGVKAGLPAANTILETPSDTFLLDFDKDLVDQIMPFDSLYQLALKNSPVLKQEQANGEAAKANYNFSKIVFFKNVYPFINYSSGNQQLASSGTLVSDLAQVINGYRYGVNVQLPLDELIGRKSRLRQADATYRAVVAKREIEALNVKRELIRVYQDMLTAQRILKVRYRDEQASAMAYQVAEVELRQGKIEPREMAQISNFYAQAKSATEYQSGEFLKHFYDLQALIGVPMQYLQVSMKGVPPLPTPDVKSKPKK